MGVVVRSKLDELELLFDAVILGVDVLMDMGLVNYKLGGRSNVLVVGNVFVCDVFVDNSSRTINDYFADVRMLDVFVFVVLFVSEDVSVTTA